MRTLTRALLILPLLVASVGFAADKPKKEGSLGTTKATGAYLTKEQLRACLAQQGKVGSDDAELVTEQAAIVAQKEQIGRTGDELKGQLDAVDRTKAEAVTGYNDAVQARDKQIDDYQARVTAFNARVDANHAGHDAFKQDCSNRRYFAEDEIAIKRGK